MNDTVQKYKSFKDFYPYYLSEHKNLTCRRLHVIGSTLIVLLLIGVIYSQSWVYLWLVPIIGYGFAWVGHFFYEKNRPATFKYPLYSLAGDWVMYWQVITGKIKF